MIICNEECDDFMNTLMKLKESVLEYDISIIICNYPYRGKGFCPHRRAQHRQ